MRGPLNSTLLAVAVFAAALPAEAICIGEEIEVDPDAPEPRPRAAGGEVESSIVLDAPPDGAWIASVRPRDIYAFSGPPPPDCTNTRFRRQDGSDVDLEVLREGTLVSMLRVPPDAVEGDTFSPFIVCESERTTAFGQALEVRGERTERAAPVIVDDSVTVVEPPEPSFCDDTPELLPEPRAHFGDFTSHVVLDVDSGADELIVDAALAPPDGSADDAVPLLEMLALHRDDNGAIAFDVRRPGRFDLHVTLTDLGTGLASEPHVISLDTPSPKFQGCSCSSTSGADVIVFLAPVALAGARIRRMRSRRG